MELLYYFDNLLIKCSISETARSTEISSLFGAMYKRKTIDYNLLTVKNRLIFFSAINIVFVDQEKVSVRSFFEFV